VAFSQSLRFILLCLLSLLSAIVYSTHTQTRLFYLFVVNLCVVISLIAESLSAVVGVVMLKVHCKKVFNFTMHFSKG